MALRKTNMLVVFKMLLSAGPAAGTEWLDFCLNRDRYWGDGARTVTKLNLRFLTLVTIASAREEPI